MNTFTTNSLSGKRALITGGTTGIGRALAIQFASYGVSTLIIGRHQTEINKTLKEMKKINPEVEQFGLKADVAKPKDIEKVFSQVSAKLGGLDILINNAALGYGGVMKGNYEDWEYIVKTNVLGYMACSHYAVAEMRTQQSGHIIHIGSMSAHTRDEGSSVYVATKAAIQGFSESLRKELNPKGIHVTLIEPGAVDTDMQPQSQKEKRRKVENMEMLEADDIADAVIFSLCQHKRSSIVEIKIRPLLQII